MKTNRRPGFTLIEILLALTIISILSIAVLVGLKPAQRLADSRDAKRAQDVNEILSGIFQCAIDKKDNASLSTCLGSYTVGNTYEIVSGAITSGCKNTCTLATSDTSCLRLDSTLSDYFTSLPQDPNNATTGHTGYSITIYSNHMAVIDACAAENSPIKVSR